jgi:ubiquinone/menaquinone biosynthesis C-methylase UbiE
LILDKYKLYISIANHNKSKNEMEFYYKEFRQKLVQFFLTKYIKKDTKILDIGCQFGDISLPLASDAEYIVGLDMSMRSISIAKDNAGLLNIGNASFVVAEVGTLPFESNSFDVILFLEVIEHLYNADLSLSEIHRVLKPDGFLLIGTPQKIGFLNSGMHLLVNLFTVFLKIILIFKTRRDDFFKGLQSSGIESPQPDKGVTNTHKTSGGHVQNYSRRGLSRVVKGHGFRLVGEGGIPLFLTRIIKYYFAFPCLEKIYKRLFNTGQSFLLSRFGNQMYLLFRSEKTDFT